MSDRYYVGLDCSAGTVADVIQQGKPDGYCIEVTKDKLFYDSVPTIRRGKLRQLCRENDATCAILIKRDGLGTLYAIDEYLDEAKALGNFKR